MVIFKPYVQKSGIYYNYAPILSFNLPIMVLVGDRNCGKTYGAMKKAFSTFKFENKKFALMRDNESAIDTMKEDGGEKIFSALRKDKKFLKDKFDLNGNSILINNKTGGYLLPVSTFYKNKGNDFADVYYIIYDEFIPEKDQIRIGDDVRKFINAVHNISRTRNCRLILLANALDKGNPILELLGFDKIDKFGFYINREKGVVLHYIKPNENLKKLKEKSLTGLLVGGSKYEANLMNNEFVNGNDFIYDKLPPRDLWGIFHNKNGVAIRIYQSKEDNEYFATKDSNPNAVNYMRWTFDKKIISPKIRLAPKEYKQFLLDIYSQHLLKFESAYIRNQFIELL